MRPVPASRPARRASSVHTLVTRLATRVVALAAAGTLSGSLSGALGCAPARAGLARTEVAIGPLAAPTYDSRPTVRGWAPAAGTAIPLWVDSLPELREWSSTLVGLAYAAARAWQTPGVPVRFVPAADPSAALVRVHWRWRVRWRGVGGATLRALNERGETEGADVWVVLARGDDGTLLPPEAIRGVLLHELGHALGLGHDRDRLAIMYRATGPRAIARRDRAALRALYGVEPREASRVAAATPRGHRP
jgi:hypothetical protein